MNKYTTLSKELIEKLQLGSADYFTANQVKELANALGITINKTEKSSGLYPDVEVEFSEPDIYIFSKDV
jgi:hypothetical protein